MLVLSYRGRDDSFVGEDLELLGLNGSAQGGGEVKT